MRNTANKFVGVKKKTFINLFNPLFTEGLATIFYGKKHLNDTKPPLCIIFHHSYFKVRRVFAVLLFKEVLDLEYFACLCSAHQLKTNIFVQFAALMSNVSVRGDDSLWVLEEETWKCVILWRVRRVRVLTFSWLKKEKKPENSHDSERSLNLKQRLLFRSFLVLKYIRPALACAVVGHAGDGIIELVGNKFSCYLWCEVGDLAEEF